MARLISVARTNFNLLNYALLHLAAAKEPSA